MDQHDIERLQTRMCEELLGELADNVWDRASYLFVSLRSIAMEIFTFYDGDRLDSLPLEDAPGRLAEELRKTMWTFETGTWHWLTLTMDKASNEVRFEYHWDDDFTQWDIRPDDEAYLDDIRTFPRPWSAIPEWHPARTHYTEATWNAYLATQGLPAPGGTTAPRTSMPAADQPVDDDTDLFPGGPRLSPDSPVSPEELFAAAQSALAQAVAESIGDDAWDRCVLTLCLVADHAAAWIDVTRSGRVERIAASPSVIDAGRRYRELAWTPMSGSWTWLECTLDMTTHEMTFEGHHDDFTGWDARPDDQAYLDDIRAFPLQWWQVPDRHPARTHYTEATWNEYRASLGLPTR